MTRIGSKARAAPDDWPTKTIEVLLTRGAEQDLEALYDSSPSSTARSQSRRAAGQADGSRELAWSVPRRGSYPAELAAWASRPSADRLQALPGDLPRGRSTVLVYLMRDGRRTCSPAWRGGCWGGKSPALTPSTK